MRDDVVGDVAAERQLNVIKGLLAVLPRNRGFRIAALISASASIRPPRVRGSLLQSKVALPGYPSANRARSRGASVLRLTHAPAARTR